MRKRRRTDGACAACGHAHEAHQTNAFGLVFCNSLHYDPVNNVGDSCKCAAFVAKPKPSVPPADVVHVRAEWTGEPPAVGDFLMAPTRPRNAYEVIEARLLRSASYAKTGGAGADFYDITARKILAKDVPVGARVHPWKWSLRTPKGEARVW